MRILVFHSVLAKFLGAVCRELQDWHSNVELHGIVTGHSFRKRVEKGGAQWISLTTFSDFLRIHSLDESYDQNFLEQMEREYGRPNLYLFAHGDWFVKDYPHRRMNKFLELAFRFMLKELEVVQPDAIVAEGLDCTLSHVLYSISRKKGIPYVFPAAARFPGRITFIRNPNDRWEKAEIFFHEYLATGIPDEFRKTAEKYLETIRHQGPVPGDLLPSNRRSLFRNGDLSYLFEHCRSYSDDTLDYGVMPPWSAIRQRFQRVYRSRYSYRNLFEQPSIGDRFIIFPLHLQPEATTLTLAPFYVDQPGLIANIAKALPVGYQLYVKEHILAVGRRRLDEYRRIVATPNVRLIHPDIGVRDLIRQSSGIFTITGTMGWEALVYEKPAITIGQPFYDASGLTYKVGDIRGLPTILQKAVHHHSTDPVRLLTWVAAAYAATNECQIGYEKVTSAEASSKENISRFAGLLYDELARGPMGEMTASCAAR